MPQKNDIANFEDFSNVLHETEQIIRQCFTQFKLEEVFLSFNGGKDCTVLLDITINILKEIYKQDDIAKHLKVVYMRTKGPFSEIEGFINEIEAHYSINLSVTEGEMKLALERALEEDKKLQACLIGTRRTDPYSQSLQFLQKTDPSWPQVLRVSPLLNWNYHQIWTYILQKKVPYCSLYGAGYTSIGSIRNTNPNPSLAYSKNGNTSYLPAWLLADPSLERAGRVAAGNGHAAPEKVTIDNTEACS